MMTYLKHVGNYQHSQLKTKKFEEIQALYEKIKRSDKDFIAIGSAEDERMIKEMNEKEFSLPIKKVLEDYQLGDCNELVGVCILELKDVIVIHMLVERRYPLSKELLQRMIDLGLEVERESFVALDLIRFIKQQIDEE
ncbi:hypothetical protein Tco_1503374 [Tanacetum coccineum]